MVHLGDLSSVLGVAGTSRRRSAPMNANLKGRLTQVGGIVLSSAPQKDFCQTRCVSAAEAEAAIADGEGTCGVCPEFDTTRNTNCPK